MEDPEIEAYNDLLKLYAGIALPGLIPISNLNYQEIAKKAFDVAEAMIIEYKKREKNVS